MSKIQSAGSKHVIIKSTARFITTFFAFFLLLSLAGFGQTDPDNESDPDLPDFAKYKINKEEFMKQRADAIGLKRGIEPGKTFDPSKRIFAIRQMEQQKMDLSSRTSPVQRNLLLNSWTELGPFPIPNGQVLSGSQLAVSGRTISIAVNPTDPNIVFVGTAQGGLYRSLNGGSTWVPLLDNAMSLAINTIAICPSQPTTIFVGTGEAGFSSDSYFGVGIYRIDNANSATPTISAPIGSAVFTGRAVGRIVVHPTNPNIIFATSTSGLGGIGGGANNVLAARGLFRSTDALSATPTFTKLTITGPAAQDRNFVDMVMDPGNPNLVLCTLGDSFSLGEGGVYRSTDALSANPTFVRTFTAGVGTSASRTELAIQRSVAGVVTVYAASGFNGGTLQRSQDGGATWTQQIDNNFCGGQCFYDIAVEVDPTNADRVYLGGTGATTTFTISTNGGTTFTSSANGLHTDSHAITVAPSDPSVIYFGSDGGIYKSTDAGANWVSLNNSTFRATQFMSLAVHPTDANFTIGGTQDNGTNFYKPNATWTRADFGDGGYSLIDQNATNTTNVDMYHTYFNNGTLQGYATVSNTASATEGNWTFRGCNGSTGNGIPCGGAVLFYAPIEQGPGNPNSVYFGANILYRSTNKGLNHTAVSQNLTNPISAIGISRQNDNVRIVGQNSGGIFGTTSGSSTLTNLDAGNTVPNNFIARAVIDPNNVNTAYVTLSTFGQSSVWKTTNLSNANPTWTSASSGIPQIPVNAFVVDPANSSNLYAGTDIGVYASEDGGLTWNPLGTGLPVVAVFDMAIQPITGVLRIATHGRGLWEISIGEPIAVIVPAGKSIVAEGCLPANGGIDPDETVTVSLCVQNTGGINTTNLVGTLLATGGVTAPSGPQTFGIVTAGGASVCKDFTFTADVLCGNNIVLTLQLQDGASDLGTVTYTFTSGSAGPVITTSYSGPAVAIPDNNAAGVNVILPVSGISGSISDIDFRFDALAGCDNTINNSNASLTHTFTGDLVFKLTSPAGTSVILVAQRGSSGINFCTLLLDDDNSYPSINTMSAAGAASGNFAPDNPLSAFDGENANGNWTLNVADVGAQDIGTINRFSLLISGSVCCTAPTCAVTGTGTTTAVTCNGSSDGTATVTLTGAGAGSPGTYSVDGGAPVAYNSNPFTVTGLSVGNHTIVATVTAAGCISSNILVNVAGTATFSATYTKANIPGCNAIVGGSITVTPVGGTAPYTYSWTGMTGAGNANQVPFSAGNVSTISGLTFGFFNVTITDAGGCGVVTINNIHIESAYTVYITNSGSASSSCGNPVGSILLYGNAGVQPYTYSIDGTTYQAGNSFINLAAGTYTGYIKDAAGCVGTKPGIIVGTAPALIALPFARAASSCVNDGSIEIYRSGGIGPYTYSLDGITYQPGNVFLNKAAGTYTAYVKDSKDCVSSAPVTVAQGASLTVTATRSPSSTCIGDGSFQIAVTGGIPPYTYSKDNINFQPGNSFAGLAAGSYIGYVVDSKGCTGQVNVTINLNTITVTSYVVAASNCLSNNGSIQLFRTGGVGPYTYSLDGMNYQSSTMFSNLPAGTYNGYVKDSKTCTAVQNNIVVGPTCAPLFSGNARGIATDDIQTAMALKVQVFPNPSSTEFTLKLEGFDVKGKISINITDVMGRKVYQIEGPGKMQYSFGRGFNAGLYMVQVIQGNLVKSIKVVKE